MRRDVLGPRRIALRPRNMLAYMLSEGDTWHQQLLTRSAALIPARDSKLIDWRWPWYLNCLELTHQIPERGSLNNRQAFLIVLEAGCLGTRRQQCWFLPRPLSLVYSPPFSPYIFTSSFLCVCLCPVLSSKEGHQWIKAHSNDLVLPQSFFNDPVFKYSHNLR